jgi:hypothetical protein
VEYYLPILLSELRLLKSCSFSKQPQLVGREVINLDLIIHQEVVEISQNNSKDTSFRARLE